MLILHKLYWGGEGLIECSMQWKLGSPKPFMIKFMFWEKQTLIFTKIPLKLEATLAVKTKYSDQLQKDF